jgi:hypothetical protein
MDPIEFINVFFSMSPASNPLGNLLVMGAGVAALILLLLSMAGILTHNRSLRAAVEQHTTREDFEKAA